MPAAFAMPTNKKIANTAVNLKEYLGTIANNLVNAIVFSRLHLDFLMKSR